MADETIAKRSRAVWFPNKQPQYELQELARSAAAAWRTASRAIDAIEAKIAADDSVARTLGDGVEFGLADLRKQLSVLKDAALRLDRTVEI